MISSEFKKGLSGLVTKLEKEILDEWETKIPAKSDEKEGSSSGDEFKFLIIQS